MSNPENYHNPPSVEVPNSDLSESDSRRKDVSLAVFLVGHVMAFLSFAFIAFYHVAVSQRYFAAKEQAELYYGGPSLSVPSWTITFLVLIPVLILPFGIMSTYLVKRAQRSNRDLSSAFLLLAAISSIAAAVKIEPLFFSLVTVIILIVAILEWVGPFAAFFSGPQVDLSRVKNFMQAQREKRRQNAPAQYPPNAQPNGNYPYGYPPQPQAPHYPQAPHGYQQPNPYGAPLHNPYTAPQQPQQPPQPRQAQSWDTQQWESPSEPPAEENPDNK